MDVPLSSPLSPNKNKSLSKIIDKYPKFFAFINRYKLPLVLAFGIILIFGLVYFIFVFNKSGFPKAGISSQKPSAVSNSISNNNLLKTACVSAINDYPEWTKAVTDLIIWENPDKSFNFRNSPEDLSTKLTSPVPPTETLADMEFLGQNEISYATIGNNSWKISTLKLNGLNAPDKLMVYEKAETVSYLNISSINKNDYIVFVTSGNKGIVRQINTNNSKEETILEIPLINTDGLKLSVSPKGTYVYFLQNDSLMFFEIASKKQIDKIDSVKSAVWVGNEHVLYSGPDGTYIYQIRTKEKSKLDKIGYVSELTFNPKDNGIIAFNENGDTKIVNCQTWQIINTRQGAELKTLTSDKTAITKKGDDFGYWRFKNKDWDVKILEDKSKFVTIWQKY